MELSERMLEFAKMDLEPCEFPLDFQLDKQAMNFAIDGLKFATKSTSNPLRHDALTIGRSNRLPGSKMSGMPRK